MTKEAYLAGTFSAIPNTCGFELPIFRSRRSDMQLIQLIDEQDNVSELIHREFANLTPVYDSKIPTRVGHPAIFSFRDLDGSLHAGTRTELIASLAPMIETGVFDSLPLLRFRLSSFCRLKQRVRIDAATALAWIKERSSGWAANSWKLESTIIPEIRRRVVTCLRTAGESADTVDTILNLIDIEMKPDGEIDLKIRLPQDFPWAARCQKRLMDEDSLLGEAVDWWPELKTCRPEISPSPNPSLFNQKGVPSFDALATARTFLDEKLFLSALSNTSAPKLVRNKLSRARSRVSQFQKIGDLVAYIERFSSQKHGQLQLDLPNTANSALEDIHDDFLRIFGQYSEERSDIRDFVRGQKYSGTVVSVFSQTYTARSGGICPVGKVGVHTAVVIKAIMSGGPYNNEWLDRGTRLKYYLRSRKHSGSIIYDEQLKENKSIIDYVDVPILVFAKDAQTEELYTYFGVFKSNGVRSEPDGSKWFDLVLETQGA